MHPEEVREDPSSCPGGWASTNEAGTIKPAPESDGDNNSSSSTKSDSAQVIFGCSFDTKGDYPHNSNDPPGYVSVHGWWLDKNNQCPSHADVTVSLYGYWCHIAIIDCEWVVLDHDLKSVKAKNKGGKRVNAREWCATNTWTLYLNVVDVNIPGQFDWPDTYEVTRDVQCRPIY